MADTKITGLTAASALDGTEVFPVDQSAATKGATAAQVKTMVRRGGTATAGSWPILGSGTVLTAEVAGAEEFDGSAQYFGLAASSRAVKLAEYIVCLSAEYTLTSTGNAQKLFNATANGTLTLPAGLYFFEALVSLRAMDGVSSSNAKFGLVGAGGATVTNILYHAVGVDGQQALAGTATGSTMVTVDSPASICTGVGNANLHFSLRGTFNCTVGGTIIPTITLAVAAAAVVRVGSYFKCRCMGPTAATYCGPWS